MSKIYWKCFASVLFAFNAAVGISADARSCEESCPVREPREYNEFFDSATPGCILFMNWGESYNRATRYYLNMETFTNKTLKLPTLGQMDDEASGVYVKPGCSITVYEHPNYQGRSATRLSGTWDLSAGIPNDTSSSAICSCGASVDTSWNEFATFPRK
jgi:hypothetical protein